MMDERGKSDRSVVPAKPSNKADNHAAEVVEGRDRAKGNPDKRDEFWTLSQTGSHNALERVGQAARQDRKQRFTALLHHIYDVDRLRTAYFAVEHDAAAGIDGETWKHYGEKSGGQPSGLIRTAGAGRIPGKTSAACLYRKSGRAEKTARCSGAGRQDRPALRGRGIERDLRSGLPGFFLRIPTGTKPASSAGRTGARNQWKKWVNWILDADLQSYFDTLQHEWLVKFLEHRIADRRVIRLIQKWLKAGVLEDGKRMVSEIGTVQGGSISPLLANIYLHYVLDLWVERWRKTQAKGDVIVVRFADDFVVGIQHREKAEQLLAELRERFAQFGLKFAPGEDAPDRVWPPCHARTENSGGRETRDIPLSGLYALLRKHGPRECSR